LRGDRFRPDAVARSGFGAPGSFATGRSPATGDADPWDCRHSTTVPDCDDWDCNWNPVTQDLCLFGDTGRPRICG
jgi:hypothetical protein